MKKRLAYGMKYAVLRCRASVDKVVQGMNWQELLRSPRSAWGTLAGPEGDIALSSRVRLARNFQRFAFPTRADEAILQQVLNVVKEALPQLNQTDEAAYVFVPLENLSKLERKILVEKHLASPDFAQCAEGRALVVGRDGAVSIMVNEEDHLRIQAVAPGLDLEQCLVQANEVDDLLESREEVAFREDLGYLASCPTNLGTGLRASVMLHLPALVMTKQASRVISAATQLGLAVRGLYGEGTEAAGNLFQVSNQLTLGPKEEEIIANLNGVVQHMVHHERQARLRLLEQAEESLADRVWRAYGVMCHARSMKGEEALRLLSDVSLGVDLGIVTGVEKSVLHSLLVKTRPGFLHSLTGKETMTAQERAALRAEVIRHTLAQEPESGQ